VSKYLPELHRSRLPRRIGDNLEMALQHAEVHGVIEKREDQIQIERVEQATGRGLIAAGQIAGLEATLVRAVPHAEGRLRAIADAGTIWIAGIVARSGF
jgi:hypothetical protein